MKKIIAAVLLTAMIFVSCKENTIPLPRAYFRIDFPNKEYRPVETNCGFSFEIPQYSQLKPRNDRPGEICWFDIDFPKLKGTIHLSYKKVTDLGELAKYIEDTRNLAYKHTIKASEIEEYVINSPEEKVAGMIYEISGNTASSLQFFLTDSAKNFVRGSLYFHATPNADSLAPVQAFIRADVMHLIDTFRWVTK